MVGITEKSAMEKFHDAIDRLLTVAERDTGQSRRIANFLLSWWNAKSCGGFDVTDLWNLDAGLKRDILVVINGISQLTGTYPDSLGYRARFDRLIRQWRPEKFEHEVVS